MPIQAQPLPILESLTTHKENKTMTEQEAKDALESMSDSEFNAFFNTLPYRVQKCCKGGLVHWGGEGRLKGR